VKNYNTQKKEQAKEQTKNLKQIQTDNKKSGKSTVKDMLAQAKTQWEGDQSRQDEEFARSQQDVGSSKFSRSHTHTLSLVCVYSFRCTPLHAYFRTHLDVSLRLPYSLQRVGVG
jgi:hypothetical protein